VGVYRCTNTPRSDGLESAGTLDASHWLVEQWADDPKPVGIPSLPLSPGERAERDHGSIETEAEAAGGERRALGWAAIAAAAAIAWIVMPVGVGILLGTLLAFALQPLFERLQPRLGARWSALAIVIGSVATLAGTVGGLAWLFVSKGTTLTHEWIASLGPGAPGGTVVAAVGRLTSRIGVPPDELSKRARALAETAATGAAAIAGDIAAATAGSLLALLFAMLSMHFILRNWQTVATRAQETFPLRPDYTAGLLAEFRRVGRTTLLGTLGTGVAQGVLATLGFWITGVPEPIFFGAAAAVASLVPPVGATLVWVPAGVVLILVGHPVRGVLELAWGAVMVSLVSEYVIRPRLVGSGGHLPPLVTFAALLGGVAVFGLKGLIVGPVLMSLAIAVLRLYATEARKRRADLLTRAT
jgi:predicted PurR-regulated permease PerM